MQPTIRVYGSTVAEIRDIPFRREDLKNLLDEFQIFRLDWAGCHIPIEADSETLLEILVEANTHEYEITSSVSIDDGALVLRANKKSYLVC